MIWGITQMAIRRVFAVVAVAALSAGCTATTTLTAVQDAASLSVKKTNATDLPRAEKLSTTSFGNYEFKVQKPGFEPLYGVLPLKFNGGYLALDILFFAPAAFFNLREVFPYYEFDLEKRVVRYREAAEDSWVSYQPSEAEAIRARKFFEQSPLSASGGG